MIYFLLALLLICCYKQLFVIVMYPLAALNQYRLSLSARDKGGVSIALSWCYAFRGTSWKIRFLEEES